MYDPSGRKDLLFTVISFTTYGRITILYSLFI